MINIGISTDDPMPAHLAELEEHIKTFCETLETAGLQIGVAVVNQTCNKQQFVRKPSDAQAPPPARA
jgi:hypothetical protein